MKEKFLYVLIGCLFFFSCELKKEEFSIHNTLSNNEIGGTISVLTDADSTISAGNFENGYLLITGKLDHAGFYKIEAQFDDKLKTKSVFPIWLSGDSISINFDEDLSAYPKVVSNEKNQNELSVFYEILEKTSAQANKDLRTAQQAFEEKQSSLRGEAYNKLFYAIDKAKQEVNDSYLKAVEQFANIYPQSAVTLKIISDTNPDFLDKNPSVYFDLISRMDGELTQSKLYKDLYTSLERKTKVAVGQTLDFKFFGTDPEGKAVDKKIIENKKVVLLTFWKSSNRLGRTFKPDYERIYKNYAAKGFQIVGISMDDKKDWWLTAVKDDKVSYPQTSDLKGIDSPYIAYYNIESVPKNILMFSNGKIIDIDIPNGSLEFEVKKALGLN